MANMKLLISLTTAMLLVFVESHVSDQDFKFILDTCQYEHNVTAAEIDSFPKNIDPDNTEDIEMKFKCLAFCILDTTNYFGSDGKVDLANLELTEEGNAKMNDCKARYDMVEDKCEYSFKMVACQIELMDEEPEEE